ncbi:hypothetical protein BsWGS_00417 [Bradybaena similaris]
MNIVQQDNHEQAAAAQSESQDPNYRPQELQMIKPDYDGNDAFKEELPDNSDAGVTSENLLELPPDLLEKMPTGKRIFGACVRKQSRGVTVYFLDNDVWQMFCAEGNEMIITKKGRRMFPVPTFIICDLDPEKLYVLSLELNSVDNNVYKYCNGKWVASKIGSCLYPTPVPGREACLHHSSPNTGLFWMKEPVSFATVKISNNLDSHGTIVLQSMRKYVMVLIIGEMMKGNTDIRIRLPETVFVAVTQYQNDNVTKMKIEHNPFANAFRTGSSKSKEKEKSKRQRSAGANCEDESKPQDVCSSNNTPTLLGSLPPESQWALSRPLLWNSSAVQLSAYLEQRRQMFQNLLSSHTGRLDLVSPNQDQTRINNVFTWPPPLPALGIGQPLCRPPEVSETPLDGRFVFPLQGGNPLAQVRQFGKLNPCSDSEVPLCLVKKLKPECNTTVTECNTTLTECNTTLTECNNSISPKFKQSPKVTRNVPMMVEKDEPLSYMQIQMLAGRELSGADTDVANKSSLHSKLVPDMGIVPRCSGDGFLPSNPVVPSEDISSHTIEMAHQKHKESVDNKRDCFQSTSSTSCRRPDAESVVTEKKEAPINLTTARNYSDSTTPECSSPALERPEVTLRNADLWATTDDVVISSNGRPMFPFISLYVSKLQPDRLYNISLMMTQCSGYLFDYIEHQWVPTHPTTVEMKGAICPHPDNPKYGRQWGTEVVFDKLRLSMLMQGKNLLKLHLRRQYLPFVVIETESQLWEYPLKDAVFITSSIDSSPSETLVSRT